MTKENTTSYGVSSWSWEDQIITYRFWGILIFFIFTSAATGYVFSINKWIFFREVIGLDTSKFTSVNIIESIATLYGIYLAWLATRTQKHYLLFLYSLFELLGISLVSFSHDLFFVLLGVAIVALGAGAITLTIPSILSGGRGGAEMFAVAFGIVTVFRTLSGFSVFALSGFLTLSNMSSLKFFASIGIPIIISILFLIPVKPTLFYENPSSKNYPLVPRMRDPVLVAILCFVPFYYVYWLYRVHGEVISLSSSNKVLSPKGAAWSIFFVPFLLPIMLATLNDQLNKTCNQQGSYKKRATWAIVLWSFIFYPVSFGFIQSGLNKFIVNGQNN